MGRGASAVAPGWAGGFTMMVPGSEPAYSDCSESVRPTKRSGQLRLAETGEPRRFVAFLSTIASGPRIGFLPAESFCFSASGLLSSHNSVRRRVLPPSHEGEE